MNNTPPIACLLVGQSIERVTKKKKKQTLLTQNLNERMEIKEIFEVE
jgi:hypothetical protein